MPMGYGDDISWKMRKSNEIDQLMNNLIGAFEKELYIIIRK
jgi:hypothetical protein